jgi:hypothetical protein
MTGQDNINNARNNERAARDNERAARDEDLPLIFNDCNDPELYDVPALTCCNCNRVVVCGGRDYERLYSSHNIGFCIKFYYEDSVCNG